MNKYFLTVGLEIHAELATQTKMFCNSKNDPDEKRPNVNVCPICLGHPGSLPVINYEAIKMVLQLGLAVGGEIADYTEFDRKNYFYPDIPKGYQISQYDNPLIKGGEIAGVVLTRIHLEEDTAKSSHQDGKFSKLDFNRAGVPLIELVTEPVINNSKVAGNFAREFQLTLIYLGIARANMEKGEMRVEANVSVSNDGSLGTKVEIKNLNSFRAVERAIDFESSRQRKALENGERVIQETRGWDENKGETFSQRIKEESHDYRYFPDPDLPKLFLTEIPEFTREKLLKDLPELPRGRREHLRKYGISSEHIENYVRDIELGKYFEEVASGFGEARLIELASNYINTDLKKKISINSLQEVVRMAGSGEISSRGAKDILKILETEGGEVREIARKHGLFQESNESTLASIAKRVIDDNPNIVAEYKAGKVALLQFFIGQGMKESGGSANPEVLERLFISLLS
jgi:aspartyl-tRNA(Asn)/glutamyl-tRNA(Gln) amidotransferase subunit B